MQQRKLRTTGEVLDRLGRLGLSVTPTMIEDDTAAHYLAERETAHRGRGGASGLWEPWMEQRAERLYRLRTLHRRTGGRGPSGDLLRLFLFFADGWGWEHVRDTCVKGYRVNVRAATKGVANRVRGQALTVENLWMYAEDIAADQYRPQEPNRDQVDRVRMTLGLLMFGMAPDGDMGTIERLADDLFPDADPNEFHQYKRLAPYIWTLLSATEHEAINILRCDVSDAVMQRALRNFRGFVWRMRYGLRRRLFSRATERPRSTSPLTAFGTASQSRFREAFRRMPIRTTPAQFLGAQFAQSLVTAHNEEQAARTDAFMLKWFAFWLQSEHCREWLRSPEVEINPSSP